MEFHEVLHNIKNEQFKENKDIKSTEHKLNTHTTKDTPCSSSSKVTT